MNVSASCVANTDYIAGTAVDNASSTRLKRLGSYIEDAMIPA